MYSILGCVMVGPVRGPWANGGRSKGCGMGTGRPKGKGVPQAGGGTLGGGMGAGRTEGTARRRAAAFARLAPLFSVRSRALRNRGNPPLCLLPAAVCLCATARLVLYGTE